jgi:hypothetical protein
MLFHIMTKHSWETCVGKIRADGAAIGPEVESFKMSHYISLAEFDDCFAFLQHPAFRREL